MKVCPYFWLELEYRCDIHFDFALYDIIGQYDSSHQPYPPLKRFPAKFLWIVKMEKCRRASLYSPRPGCHGASFHLAQFYRSASRRSSAAISWRYLLPYRPSPSGVSTLRFSSHHVYWHLSGLISFLLSSCPFFSSLRFIILTSSSSFIASANAGKHLFFNAGQVLCILSWNGTISTSAPFLSSQRCTDY